MRAGGINWVAVLVAALAIYLIGFAIYGIVIPEETWLTWEGDSPAQLAAVGDSRMPFGVIMPLMMGIFLAVLFRWGRVDSAWNGAKWAAVVALASAVPAEMYAWVYGVGMIEITVVDGVHLLLGHLAAGAIIGGWR